MLNQSKRVYRQIDSIKEINHDQSKILKISIIQIGKYNQIFNSSYVKRSLYYNFYS